MRALVMEAFRGPLAVTDLPDPTLPEGGAILRIEACGICRSDHHAWSGVDPDVELPHVMGHEFAGVVEEADPATGLRPGQRVTAPFILSCGTCGDCTDGQPTICDHQHVVGFSGPGAFAQYLAVPTAGFNVVPLPDAVGFEVAAAMGCRVTTAWRALVDRAALRPGEWVAIHGCGGVGLSALLIARALGARVIGIDPNSQARALANALGADLTLDAGPGTIEAIHEATRGGAHVALDALGIQPTFEASLRALRKLGRQVQVGMPVGKHAVVPLPLLDLIYARQLSLHGMRGLGAPSFPDLLALLEDGRLDLTPMITDTCALDGVEPVLHAMDTHAAPGVTIVTDFEKA
ncbi:MAG: zinc-binding dehydrogenase [Shimia sp.]